MAIYCSRRYYQLIKYLVTCMIMSAFLLSPLSLITENYSLFHSNLSQIHSENEFLFTNQSLPYEIETTKFYPYLPIQIYTKNRERFLELQNKTKKVILLANSWFNDPWPLKSLRKKASSGNMSELYCPFLNNYCEITNDITRFKQADGVVYHIIDNINRSDEILKHRHSSQRFIFALWEPPINSPDLSTYNQFFNWTMTYRFDSHIFAPYYSCDAYRPKNTHWLKDFVSNYQLNEEKLVLYENINVTRKKGTAAALISNCGVASKERLLIIRKLRKYIDVTIYGKCGKPCPKSKLNETIDCRTYIAKHYYFILAFENSYCQDYATEKIFRTLPLPIIPVVFGQINYTRFIPQSAFIDTRQFSSISKLANRLIQIRNNLTLYQEYFQWKRQFIWGGFSDFMTPFCDLCLRLHLDNTPNIIDNVHKWWFHKTCQPEVKKYVYLLKNN